jgi:hypothetical protein
MLKNLESLCKHAVNYGETKISEELVKEILGGEKKVVKKESPKKVEKKAEPVKKVEKKVVKKKVVKKKSKDEESPNKDEKKQVYKPDQPLNIGRSSEEMLNKDTDELFDDNNQYY